MATAEAPDELHNRGDMMDLKSMGGGETGLKMSLLQPLHADPRSSTVPSPPGVLNGMMESPGSRGLKKENVDVPITSGGQTAIVTAATEDNDFFVKTDAEHIVNGDVKVTLL